MMPSATHGDGTLRARLETLWQRQANDWSMLREGLQGLRGAPCRSFDTRSGPVIVQNNRVRMRSAAARIDAGSLARRPCFLCTENLPAQQHRVTYRDDWLILCNPAPLAEPHFTLVSRRHAPQSATAALDAMAALVDDLGGTYTVFYNGPRAGASAPDHLHAQAMPAAALPFARALLHALAGGGPADASTPAIAWVCEETARTGVTQPPARPAVIVTSPTVEATHDALVRAISTFAVLAPPANAAEPATAAAEPMFNLFMARLPSSWTAWFFPRAAHRPSCYGQDDEAFLVSPGAVDLCGLMIVPRARDFARLDARRVETILAEILLAEPDHCRLGQALRGANRAPVP